MRTLFFLLLFINLGFAVYIQLEPAARSGIQPGPELQPEKIKPLPAVAAPATCLEWGTFVEAELDRVEAAIARHELNGKMDLRAMGKAPVYWIHIPPLSSKRHAEKKIGELRRRGVTTYTLVQDDSKWNNTISMGFFEDIKDAQAAMAALRSKGVRSAIIGARNLEQVKFVASSPSESLAGKMMDLKQEFPASELKTTRCSQEKQFD